MFASETCKILIGEDSSPVYRPHGESLEIGVGVFDRFTEVELLNIEGIDGETACLGWVLHHGYTGALPVSLQRSRPAGALRQYSGR